MLNIGIVRSITYYITLVSTLIVLIFIPEPVSAQSSWTERISFGGDFRQRHEGFFQADTRARQRLRFRFRLSANAEINDDVITAAAATIFDSDVRELSNSFQLDYLLQFLLEMV